MVQRRPLLYFPRRGDFISADLNGSNEYFLNSTAQNISIVNAWSVMLWVKPDDDFGRLFTIYNAAGSGNVIDIRKYAGGSPSTNKNIQIYIKDASGAPGPYSKQYFYNNLLNSSVWAQVLITWDSTNLKLYKNGYFESPSSIGTDGAVVMVEEARKVCVGNFAPSPNSGDNYNGLIHSVAVWNTALAASEAVSIFNSGVGAYVDLTVNFEDYASASNLQHWWRIGLDSSDIGEDYGSGSPLIDIMQNAVGITTSDLETDSPL